MSDPIASAVFGLLFNHSRDAAFIVQRASGQIVSANARTEELLMREVDSLVGADLADLLAEPERDLDSPGHYEEVGLRRGDGYAVYVELHVSHLETEAHGGLAAYMARDTSERRILQSEIQAKHTALFTAYADLERTHVQLADAKRELEVRNRDIAMLAWKAAMGELVAGVAHHLNNPVGALASTIRRMTAVAATLPETQRAEMERLLVRVGQLVHRIEHNVSSIIQATRAHEHSDTRQQPDLPPELSRVLTTFVERLEDLPAKDPA